jgi:ubiquinone/menaquinone biosynthesis C-methylase UbiE
LSPTESLDPRAFYLDVQAYVGTTKHMGGQESTQELAALCHLDRDSYVLDVGCGVGATACHLATVYGCRVIGADLREAMVAEACERARRERVQDRTTFWVADAQALPAEDATFDVVVCESVAAFIDDKRQVIGEYARVVRPGGYVGLNEETWIQEPSKEMVDWVRGMWGIAPDLLTAGDWAQRLRDAGLQDVVARMYKVDARRESTQIRRYRLHDMWRMFYRALRLYIQSPAFRQYAAQSRRLPRGLFEHLGYGLFVGRKQQ